MPPRDWRLRVNDILEAISRIQRFVGEMNFEEFNQDEKTIDAVVRNFTIIGEASRNIPSDVQTRNPQVPWNEKPSYPRILCR